MVISIRINALSLFMVTLLSTTKGFNTALPRMDTFRSYPRDGVCQTCAAAVDSTAGKNTESPYSSVSETTVRVPKPMGVVLEEIDASDATRGVRIVQISPDGNAAALCALTGSADLCVRDKILAVNGAACSGAPFETVMDEIASSPGDSVELTLGRPRGSVAVRWSNGVCVAAQPGEYLGNVADEAMVEIPYSCRSGSCGTCEQAVLTDDGGHRYLRPCSARIPQGLKSMVVVASDRFE